jgi:predicted ATPase with chaperone activity
MSLHGAADPTLSRADFRAIADLAGTENIEEPHLLEAIHYRRLDQTLFY